MAPEQPIDELEEILFEILSAVEEGAEVEDLLAKHPQHATVLRRRLNHLGCLSLDGSLRWSPPETLGPYRLDASLGSGGMGDVWRAVEQDSNQEVALKIVRDAVLAPNQKRRFEREAAALSRLNHPGIVGIHDAGEADGFRYIAMELLEGQSLDQILQQNPTPSLHSVLAWGSDLALALGAAHAENVVHRDVKPSNIQILPNGHAVLMDFGLTRGLGPSSLSITGRFVGSPHYAAPEQIHGSHDEIGPASDIYSLGVTLYQALCGELPFEGSSTEQVFHRILTAEPASMRKLAPELSRELEAVIFCALEKDPQARYASAKDFALDLQAASELRPVVAKAHGPIRRAKSWSRQHPALAASLGVVLFALITVISASMIQNHQQQEQRKNDARDQFVQAEHLFEKYLQESIDLPDQLARFAWYSPHLEASPFKPQVTAELNQLQRDIEQSEALREQVFTAVLEHLRRAGEWNPDMPETDVLRARLYLERWRLAKKDSAQVMMDFFADRVREYDHAGEHTDAIDGIRRISITSHPPGARVDAFIFRRHDALVEGGDPRLVPIPVNGKVAEVLPGTTVLKVFQDSGALRAEDLIVEVAGYPVELGVFLFWPTAKNLCRVVSIDGQVALNVGHAEDLKILTTSDLIPMTLQGSKGTETISLPRAKIPLFFSALELAVQGDVSAKIWRNGIWLHLPIPTGTLLRPTAAPLIHGAQSALGISPLKEIDIAGDLILLLVRKEGYQPVRRVISEEEEEIDVILDPIQQFPAPFVRVQCKAYSMVVMDREISVAEYAEFLREAPEQVLPMGWYRNAEHGLTIPAGMREDFPVQSITWDDANAYAAWRTEKARQAGQSFSFKLPNYLTWHALLRADVNQRDYVWGLHYRSHYAKSCFARHRPRPEPALRFPIDETMHGLHDTAGGVSELCDGWFWPERKQRPVFGGSWVNGNADRFEMDFVWGTESNIRHEYVGFRLQLVEDAE